MATKHISEEHLTPDAQETLRTLSTISEDEFNGLSLYERKCVLINHEIDGNGMGRYQWYIWGLCGFGYLLDLLWAQAFGLVLQPLMQEMGFPGEPDSVLIVAKLNVLLTSCYSQPIGKYFRCLFFWPYGWCFCLGRLG